MNESFAVRLKDYLDAAYALLAVETHEELRVLADVRTVVGGRKVVANSTEQAVAYQEWDMKEGLCRMTYIPASSQQPGGWVPDDAINGSRDLIQCLGILAIQDKPMVTVIKDAHPFMEVPGVWRALRNMVGRLRSLGSTVILLSPRLKIPAELSKEIQIMDFKLPSRAELEQAFYQYMAANFPEHPGVEPAFSRKVAEAAMGMTLDEADNAFALASITELRRRHKVEFDERSTLAEDVFQTKIANLKLAALDYRPSRFGFESIGGLENVKGWISRRVHGFSDEARALNLPYPRGILLGGVRGCGKSAIAEAIAYELDFPLFMLDLGRLFNSKLGETEAATREVIRLMESMGRAVVLIDELEKSLGTAATSGSGDSGVSSRMLGTLLTWISSKTCPVFLIGTMNNVAALPPELTRKGRFDCLFWVDLPTASERKDIFNALLKYKFKRQDVVLEVGDILIDVTEGFTGAEIEAIIEEALYDQLIETDNTFHQSLAIQARSMVPQSRRDTDSLANSRKLAQSFQPASHAAETRNGSSPSRKRNVAVNN